MPTNPPTFRRATPKAVKRYAKPEQDRRAARPLSYSSNAWQSLRRQVMVRDGHVCVMCRADGVIRMGSQVDHMDGDAWNNDMGNLQLLCGPCHSRKTAEQDGGFGNQREARQG